MKAQSHEQPASDLHPPTDPERPRKARELAAARRRLFFAGIALALAYPLVVWQSGLSRQVWDGLFASGMFVWVAAAVFLLLYWSGQSLLGLPLSYYGGFVLSHRYDLSRQRPLGWLVDWAKAAALGIALAIATGLVFFLLLQQAGEQWWWLFGLVLVGGGALLSYVAPYVLVPLFFRMRPLEDEHLLQRLNGLLERAGVPVRQVCSLDFSRRTVEANAAVIGLGSSRRIVLADTLLQSFEPDEIESVVAHELGHHVHRDVLRLLAVHGLVILIGLAAANWLGLPLLMRLLEMAPQLVDLPAAFPLLALAAQTYLLTLMPVTNGLSRAIEGAADRYALTLGRDARAFASALRRLAYQNLAEEQPPAWAEWLLYTHPAIGRRIRMAEEWDGSIRRGANGHA